jgi:hypothetical protein
MNRKSSTARLLAEKLTNIQGEIAKLKSDLTKLQEREKELLSAQRVIESLSDGGNAPQELALKPTPKSDHGCSTGAGRTPDRRPGCSTSAARIPQ